MRVALTGAGGFTGRYLRNALERAGVTPVVLEVDLRDAAAVGSAVDALEFDSLIHLAGQAFVDSSDFQAFYSVNQIGTFNLLDAVARAKRGVRCILASTAQVYGPNAEGHIREDAPANPVNHYAISKHAMEQGAVIWRDRLDIVVARPFNYTGIGQETRYLIPKIVEHFRRREAVIELGNTWVRRDFGDVRSVADAYMGLAMAREAPPVVNIATGSVSSIDGILERLTTLSGHTIEVRVNPALIRKRDVEVLSGDVTLLREILPDWQPRPIGDTLAWMFGSASAE